MQRIRMCWTRLICVVGMSASQTVNVSAIVLLCAVRVMASWLAHLVFQKSEDVYIIPQLIMFAHICFNKC